MFDAALGLAPDWEKPAFCYAVYLDQLMVDAQRRQQALQQALAQQAAAHKVLPGALCPIMIRKQAVQHLFFQRTAYC